MGSLEELVKAYDDFENGFISLYELLQKQAIVANILNELNPKMERINKKFKDIKLDGR